MRILSNRASLKHWGTPFLFVAMWLGVAVEAAETPQALTTSGRVASDATGSTLPVRLQGDRLEFHQDDQQIIGDGNVVVWMGGMMLRADHLHMDIKENSLWAEGRVVWSEKGSTVYARRVVLNLDTRQGQAFDIDYAEKDWRATGAEAAKKSDKDIFLKHSQASSCFRANPHYRVTAREIHLVLGERITARHVWIHTGVMPVFYLPWFTRNLKDPRPPIVIRPGFSERLGWNVQVTYNYFLNENHYGNLRYDYMEKWGHGEGFEHQYKIGKGRGKFGGYYTRNLADTEQKWTGRFEHGHDLGGNRSLLARVDLLSDSSVNDTFNQSQVDVFERRSFLSIRSNQQKYSWNLESEERQALSLDPQPDGSTKRDYVTTRRQLPNVSFNLYQRPLWEKGRVYYGFGANAGRLTTVPLSPTGRYLTETATTLVNASWSPAISQTMRLNRYNSLSSRLTLTQTFNENEERLEKGQVATSYGTSVTLRTRWWPGINTALTHGFNQNLSQRDTLIFQGVTRHQLAGRLNLGISESLELNLSQTLELRPYALDDFKERLGLLRLESSWDLGAGRDVGANAQIDWITGRFKTIDGFVNLLDKAGRWKINFNSNWVNNAIRLVSASDARAPLVYEFERPRRTPDLFLLNTRTTLGVSPKWKLSYFQRLNVMTKRVDEQALTLWRDLHCWDIELSMRRRIDGTFEYGFSLSLKAAPDVKASSNQLEDEFFSDAHFGVY